MKKLVLLFGAAVLALTSCSKDSTNSDTTGLVKTITSGNTQLKYSYDGAKILGASATSYAEGYTYSGNLITVVTVTVGNYHGSTKYTYANGKLLISTSKDNSAGGDMIDTSSKTYAYNPDGTITVQENTITDGTATLDGTRKLTFHNGNLVKEETFDTTGTSTGGVNYEFDTKNNPYNKVIGYNKLLTATIASANNITKSTAITSPDGGDLTTTVKTNSYTYNSDGYPTSKTTTTVTTVGSNAPSTTTSTAQYSY